MPDSDGLDRLNQRMARGRRAVPAPRRSAHGPDRPVATSDDPGPFEPTAAAAEAPNTPNDADRAQLTQIAAPQTTPIAPPGDPTTPQALSGPMPREPLAAGEAQANLAVRVRRSLDLRLDDLLHQLRHQGLRSSKAELVEMLLWELPSHADPDFEDRLVQFRRAGGRG